MEEIITSFKYTKDNLIHWNDYETGFQLANPSLFKEVDRQKSKLYFVYRHDERMIEVTVSVGVSKELEGWIIAAVNHLLGK